MPQSALISLYFTLIHPYLEYCNVVWAIDRSTVLQELFICQKKAVRIITGSKYNSHTTPLFSNLRILPITNLNDFQVACFIYRCVNNLLPQKFCIMFNSNSSVHSHNTRHKSDLRHQYHRLCLRKNTVRIFGTILFNSLSIELRNISTYTAFRSNYKNKLLDNLSNNSF